MPKLIAHTLDAANCVSLHLVGKYACGERLLVQTVFSNEPCVEDVIKAVTDLYARFEEEAQKPAPPKPEPTPVTTDPNVEVKAYDAIAQEARERGLDTRSLIAFMKATGWEHSATHAGMTRRKSGVS